MACLPSWCRRSVRRRRPLFIPFRSCKDATLGGSRRCRGWARRARVREALACPPSPRADARHSPLPSGHSAAAPVEITKAVDVAQTWRTPSDQSRDIDEHARRRPGTASLAERCQQGTTRPGIDEAAGDLALVDAAIEHRLVQEERDAARPGCAAASAMAASCSCASARSLPRSWALIPSRRQPGTPTSTSPRRNGASSARRATHRLHPRHAKATSWQSPTSWLPCR